MVEETKVCLDSTEFSNSRENRPIRANGTRFIAHKVSALESDSWSCFELLEIISHLVLKMVALLLFTTKKLKVYTFLSGVIVRSLFDVHSSTTL